MEAAGSSERRYTFKAFNGFTFHRRDINIDADTRTANLTTMFYTDINSKEFLICKMLTQQQCDQLQRQRCRPVKIHTATNQKPFPVSARSKAWVCGQSLAGIAGSNPAGDIDVSVMTMVCVVR